MMFFSFRGDSFADAGDLKIRPQIFEIPPIHPFVWHCFDAGGQSTGGHMRFFSPKDGGQPPRGTSIPGDYLFMKEDKLDWTLQFLLHFLGTDIDPCGRRGNVSGLPERGMHHIFCLSEFDKRPHYGFLS
jgi:hypothetical protein